MSTRLLTTESFAQRVCVSVSVDVMRLPDLTTESHNTSQAAKKLVVNPESFQDPAAVTEEKRGEWIMWDVMGCDLVSIIASTRRILLP